MAEEKAEKPAAPKKRAAKAGEAAAPKKAPAKKAAPKKAAAAAPAPAAAPAKAPRAKPGQQVKVTQIASPIGREAYQRATLKGLGLNKLHRSRVLEDTPAVRGMIERVKHLVRIEAAG